MILDTLDNLHKYASLNPLFPKAIEFLTTTDLASLPLGRNEIQGDEIFANVMEAQPRTKEEIPVEVHRQYIDIQRRRSYGLHPPRRAPRGRLQRTE